MDEEPGLVARILAGDSAAERAFYDAHVDGVYRLAYRMTGDRELAREFTQDAFIRAFSRLGQFRGESSVATWLRRVAMSVVLNGLEKVKRRRAVETSFDDVDPTALATSPVEGDAGLRGQLARALNALPVAQRSVVVLHDVEGYRHEDVAAMLDITVSTSKVRLFRARATLRASLANFAEEWKG